MAIMRGKDNLLKRSKGITSRDLIPAGRPVTRQVIDDFVKKFKGGKDREAEKLQAEKLKELSKVKTVGDIIEKPKHKDQIVNANSLPGDVDYNTPEFKRNDLLKIAKEKGLKLTGSEKKDELIEMLSTPSVANHEGFETDEESNGEGEENTTDTPGDNEEGEDNTNPAPDDTEESKETEDGE